ncbi:6632_t:CDS:2, partial [Gigaspora rosea]
MSTSTNTSFGENASISTIDLLKKCTETEQLIAFLDKQDLGLKEHHFKIFRDQEMDGIALLRSNVEKLMQVGFKLGPAERITEFIDKIKGDDQAVATSSREKELLQKLAELEKQLIYGRCTILACDINICAYFVLSLIITNPYSHCETDFDVLVVPKRTKSFKWPANIESTTIEEFKKSLYDIYKTPTLENPSVTPSKPFSEWTFPKVCQLYELSDDPNPSTRVFPVFSCGCVDLKDEKAQTVVRYLMNCLKLLQDITPLDMAYEATKSIYSYCYLVAGVSFYKDDFNIIPEKLIQGRNGQGNVNYAIECSSTRRAIGLVEVKKDDFLKGFAQASVQMESSLTGRKRKANEIDDDERGVDKVFGIVTDAEKWYFMTCTLDEKGKPSFGLSKPISVFYNNNGDMQINVEKVLGHIVWLLKEAQKSVETSLNGGQQRVLKKHKSS